MESSIDDWLNCPLCAHPYSSEVPDRGVQQILINSGDQERTVVPVQSNFCSHIICYSCLQQQSQSLLNNTDEEQLNNSFVKCPLCCKENAFDVKNPIISVVSCHLLKFMYDHSLDSTGRKMNGKKYKALNTNNLDLDKEESASKNDIEAVPVPNDSVMSVPHKERSERQPEPPYSSKIASHDIKFQHCKYAPRSVRL